MRTEKEIREAMEGGMQHKDYIEPRIIRERAVLERIALAAADVVAVLHGYGKAEELAPKTESLWWLLNNFNNLVGLGADYDI